MFALGRWVGSAVVLCLGILPLTEARAIELSGAWASQADLCNLVFAKKGDKVEYTEFSELYGSGFIINGDRIRGKAGSCTIKSNKQDGNSVELSAACASSIMTQDLRFSLTIIDDDNISRAFPEIPGMTLKYARCKF
jgi:hypothetical protein